MEDEITQLRAEIAAKTRELEALKLKLERLVSTYLCTACLFDRRSGVSTGELIIYSNPCLSLMVKCQIDLSNDWNAGQAASAGYTAALASDHAVGGVCTAVTASNDTASSRRL